MLRNLLFAKLKNPQKMNLKINQEAIYSHNHDGNYHEHQCTYTDSEHNYYSTKYTDDY